MKLLNRQTNPCACVRVGEKRREQITKRYTNRYQTNEDQESLPGPDGRVWEEFGETGKPENQEQPGRIDTL